MLVGRAAELKVVLDCLEATARRQRPSIVLVRGPGGIGKTAICQQIMADLRAREVVVLAGRADDVDRWVPYGALRDVLSRLQRSASRSPARRRGTSCGDCWLTRGSSRRGPTG